MNNNDYTKKWRKTKRGHVTNLYHKMKGRNSVDFSLNDFHNFADCKKFERLYREWVASNYNKQYVPSIDRISNKKSYTLDNIQWLTWAENKYKQSMEGRNKNGPVAMKMGNKTVAVFKSQRDAVKKTGLSQSNMSAVLNKKRKTCGGYGWEYVTGNIHDNYKTK